MEEVTILPGGKPPPAPGTGSGKDAGGEGEGSIFAQLGDEKRLEVGLPVYRKVRSIGQGAFGKAYLVEAVRGKRKGPPSSPKGSIQRVLKKLPLSGIAEARREAAFNEALLMRRISRGCPFITQFAEVLLAKGGTMLCIVMEFCSGGDLRNFLRAREGDRLPEAEVLHLMAQIGHALQHCHCHGVVHRDVKPENCFFRSQGGDLLLGDFGISCALDERSFAKTCVGSPLYMSPEIVNQDKYSFATDVWSLGVMLYEAAMLAPPFKGNNICQLAFRIVTATPEPLDASQYSPALQQFVDRLLHKEHGNRISLQEALVTQPLEPAAANLARLHGLEWPPHAREAAGASHSSRLVQRLRGHVAGTGTAASAAEPEWAVEDEVTYGDDFEEASESDASYEADFEEASDDEAEELGQACPALEELSEAQVRERIRAELGEEALLAAERIGVVSFLGGFGAAGKPLAAGT